MNRRRLLVVLGAIALAPRAASAQAKQPFLIGWLSSGSRETNNAALAAFKEELLSLGWKEGQHFVIDARWAEGQLTRMRSFAQELAARKPSLIVAISGQAVAAAAAAAPRTPIVQATGGDPVVAGLAASWARPGGMVTGISNLNNELVGKLLEFLLAAVPKIRQVGFLGDSNSPNRAHSKKAALRSAAQHSITAQFAEVARNDEIEAAISLLANKGIQGLVVLSSPLLNFERKRILKHSFASRFPVISTTHLWSEDGALLSYGVDTLAQFRRAAYYVDRILKGTKPGDLPIEQPTKLELVVNQRSAKSLGIAIPQSVLLQAHRVIE